MWAKKPSDQHLKAQNQNAKMMKNIGFDQDLRDSDVPKVKRCKERTDPLDNRSRICRPCSLGYGQHQMLCQNAKVMSILRNLLLQDAQVVPICAINTMNATTNPKVQEKTYQI